MPKVKINDINMYYEVHGKGVPLVLVGGFAVDHKVWALQVERFQKRHQVILLDNRGSGQTDAPAGPYTMEQMVADVVALCAQLGVEKAHFVGNSMGGIIVQYLAFHHPSLVQSAVISNSAATLNYPFRIYLNAQLQLLKSGAPLDVLIEASSSWVYSYQFLSQPGTLEQIIQLGIENPYPFTIQGYEGQYAALSTCDSDAWVEEIRVPTLIVAGEQDIIFSPASVKQLSERIPNAKYFCFPDCGHLPGIEHPEQFAKVVLDFIAVH